MLRNFETKVKSIILRGEYLLSAKPISRREIERELGEDGYELTDGIMWVFDYVVDAKVLVYKPLKLYFYLDPENDGLKEIRFGDVNEEFYD